jgi:hypothetical protein
MAKGTVTVNLARDWFAPDGSLYQVADNPHEFPAEWADPPEKEPKVKKEEEEEGEQKYAFLPSSAELVPDAKTVATVQKTGGGEEVIVPTAVEGDVKSVGNALDDKGIEQGDQSLASAAKGAKEQDLQLGGRPRESGPLPAGTKK